MRHDRRSAMITDEFVVEKPSFVEIKLTGDNIILYDYLLEQRLDTYYDLIEIYKDLDEYDQKMVWSIMQTVKKTCEKRKKDKENTEES